MPTLINRTAKGSELTYEEVDGNFSKLNTTVSAAITAAGTVQGDAAAITSSISFITSSSAGSGVRLPTPDIGSVAVIVNHSANPVKMYPASGHTIDNGAANAPLLLPQGCAVEAVGTTSTNWTGVTFDMWDDENNVLVLPKHNTTPPAPPTDYMGLFTRSLGGRMMPAFVGPSGLDSVLQPHMARNGWAEWKPAGTGTTVSAIGAAALSATGTATAATYATTSLHTRCARVDYLVTTAATTAVAGYRIATNAYRINEGFHHIFRVAPATGSTLATNRFFCGMSSLTAAPTDVNPSTLTNMAGVGFDAADTNWQIMFNDGTGTATKVDTGIAAPTTDRSGPYSVAIFCPPGGAFIGVRFTDETTGTAFETKATTDLIATATAVGPRAYHSVGGTSSVVGLTLFSGYVETDN